MNFFDHENLGNYLEKLPSLTEVWYKFGPPADSDRRRLAAAVARRRRLIPRQMRKKTMEMAMVSTLMTSDVTPMTTMYSLLKRCSSTWHGAGL